MKYAVCRLISFATGNNEDISHYKNLKRFKLYEKKAKERILLVDFRNVRFGLADRIIGILSLFMFAKENNRGLKIIHRTGFNLEDYLLPNQANWFISEEEISHGLNESRILVTSLSRSWLKRYGLPKLNPRIMQYHAYVNHDFRDFLQDGSLDKYNRKELFDELFKPAPRLEQLLSDASKAIHTNSYIAVHIRFLNYLEQVERTPSRITTEEEKIEMISACKKRLEEIHSQYPDQSILLFSDSNRFIQEDFPSYVCKLPGRVGHVSAQHQDLTAVVDKAFIDLFMISRAERVINIVDENLWGMSGFSRIAAELGGKQFSRIPLRSK